MAYVTKLFNDNFIEYASYVIKDRAIPHLEDGLKPVQRRILHSLFEMDDGKFHKVANVVGHCMKYHPHGDASINSALVVLANKDYFIDKQGNFGNIFTGDEASAARYIECRALPLAKKVFYNPELTTFEPSYDSRNKEPVTFPAKLPVVLIQGAEGIAVGMSTKVLPHNFVEVLKAVISAIKGEGFVLYPDFPTGGFMDVSEYNDGMGRVLVRAKLDMKDPKKIIVRELPFGSTTQSLITSLESAAKKNKIKISGLSDFTTENVEIEIKLARGVHTSEVVDSLYAFTECQSPISVNLLVIRDNKPVSMTVTEVVKYHAGHLVEVLRAELKLEDSHLRDKLHAKTLEQIFIEERIYKRIEEMTTQAAVIKAVIDGFGPFMAKIKRKIAEEDIEQLLKIPIRRISRYDINRAKKEMKDILDRLKEIKHHLAHIEDYAVGFVNGILKEYGGKYRRQTKITSFEKINVREVAARNLELKYDEDTGYLGYEVKTGSGLFEVSTYDRVLVIRRTGIYSVIDAPDKLFVDKGMLYCCLADKDELAHIVFSLIYRNEENGCAYIKRCKIEQYIIDKTYSIVPDGGVILAFTIDEKAGIKLSYKPRPKLKNTAEMFDLSDYLVKGVKTSGVRLSVKDAERAEFTQGRAKRSDKK